MVAHFTIRAPMMYENVDEKIGNLEEGNHRNIHSRRILALIKNIRRKKRFFNVLSHNVRNPQTLLF